MVCFVFKYIDNFANILYNEQQAELITILIGDSFIMTLLTQTVVYLGGGEWSGWLSDGNSELNHRSPLHVNMLLSWEKYNSRACVNVVVIFRNNPVKGNWRNPFYLFWSLASYHWFHLQHHRKDSLKPTCYEDLHHMTHPNCQFTGVTPFNFFLSMLKLHHSPASSGT